MISSAWKTPSEPPAQGRSPKLSAVGRVYGEASKNGTPCQEWLFNFAGVAWSPVTARASGPRSSSIGIWASTSSITEAFLSKSPSSPAAPVGFLERGEGGVHPEAAHENGVRGVLVGQDLVCLLDEGVRDVRTLLGL